MVGPLATGPPGRGQQRGDFGPGLIGELVAADHATSHIEQLMAARPYNTAVRQALELPATAPRVDLAGWCWDARPRPQALPNQAGTRAGQRLNSESDLPIRPDQEKTADRRVMRHKTAITSVLVTAAFLLVPVGATPGSTSVEDMGVASGIWGLSPVGGCGGCPVAVASGHD
jgi:hypothetical protein